MSALPTRYLLRLDDLCPTSDKARWDRVLALAEECGVRPILAVVPDNRDPDLVRGEVDPDFWPRLRRLEAAGATVALHGFQHLASGRGGGLLPLHNETEFAGIPEATQREWISAGLAILRGEGLTPKLWIAPRHGQDRATLRALKAEGIEVLSDGFAREPYRRGGVVWLPQQIWEPVERGPGMWTLCLHPNTMSDADFERLAGFVRGHNGEFASFEEALSLFPPRAYGLRIALSERAVMARIRLSKARRRWMGRLRHG